MPDNPKLEPFSSELSTTRQVFRWSIPGFAEGALRARLKQLHKYYANEREYVESLVAYDLWAEKDHLLTGDAFKSRKDRNGLWQEVVRDFGKPNKTGSFFEHQIERIIEARKTHQKLNPRKGKSVALKK